MHNPADWMALAISQAQKGLGLTAPNPAVGAVVVRDGVCIGRGFHAKAGTPHAEPLALADAGEAARGADLYVTLEPCCTHGRTPPCTEAIKRAGIRRVFVGCTDPNPLHAGRAYPILEAAGIEVHHGIREAECRHLIRAFVRAHLQGLPWVTLKLATSLDGRIADAEGRSRWISGPAARERVQALRREADAILVGSGTARLDNPGLRPDPAAGRNPWRIIPDRPGLLPESLAVFTDAHRQRTLCLLGPEASASRRDWLTQQGVVWMEAPTRNGHFDWPHILPSLAERGIQHLLCEGGGQLAAALLRQQLVQELHWIHAPLLLGSGGRPAVDFTTALADAPRFTPHAGERLGDDVWTTFFLAS